MTTNNETYSSSDIKILDDREHVRMRTQLYLGNMHPATFKVIDVRSSDFKTIEQTFIPAAYKAVGEIIDNCIDELVQISKKNKQISIDCDPTVGYYKISDTGRGVPIDIHETGTYTPEVVYGSLRSGRNFKDDKVAGVQGMNGVGSAVTNFTSTSFGITIDRDAKQYVQTFSEGGSNVTPPRITKGKSGSTGTTIEFNLDKQVFKDVTIPNDITELRAHYIALSNPDIKVKFNGEVIQYKRGFIEYIESRFKSFFQLTLSEEKVHGNIFIIPVEAPIDDETVFSWVNSSLLLDGGLCNTQIVNAFVKKVGDYLQPQIKKYKSSKINTTYVKQKFIVIADLKISDPSYDNQAKTRLTNPDIRKELTTVIDEQWPRFVKSNKVWLDNIVEYSVNATLTKNDEKAIKDLEDRIKRRKRAPGLIEASSTNRQECRLLVMEGASAKSSAQQARDAKTTAALDMSGKFNNVYDCTPAQVIEMVKLKDLLSTVGLVPGRPAIRSKLRYGKFIIAVDADMDGQDIFCNYINLFYKFWPELLDPTQPPFVHKLIVPNVVASKGKTRVHFKSRQEFEVVAEKYKGWTIEYMKGLGSMTLIDWKMILSSDEYELPVVSDEYMAETLELLFGPNADKRKEWLSDDN